MPSIFFFEKDRASFDGLGGTMYWSVESKLSLDSSLFDRFGIDNKEDWVDPFIGLKGKTMSGRPIDRLTTF